VDCAASSAFSTEFLRLIDQALSLGPASRPPGAAAFAHSLTQAAAAVDDAIVAEPPPLPAAFALEPSAQSAIQSALAECIGPIASVVLKKALASAENWPALTSALAENLPDAAVQKLFLQQIAHLAPPTQGAQPSVPAAVASPANVAASTAAHDNFDPEMLVQLEAELANQIGAIARIVLKRCVARASNRQALFKMLADEMGDPALGKKFLDWANARFTV
jgi:serine/threonine-protein kinase